MSNLGGISLAELFYWRYLNFIGGVHNFIGDNLFLLAKIRIYRRFYDFIGERKLSALFSSWFATEV
jgi:hypothetical protein